jgi:TnpA family transposase
MCRCCGLNYPYLDREGVGGRRVADKSVAVTVPRATANEAPYVLDGLLYHQSSLITSEHYTDTGGFSDHIFAMCRLLGFLFAPRGCAAPQY